MASTSTPPIYTIINTKHIHVLLTLKIKAIKSLTKKRVNSILREFEMKNNNVNLKPMIRAN